MPNPVPLNEPTFAKILLKYKSMQPENLEHFTIYPQSVMLLGEISGHLGVQSYCVQELGPQSHQMGSQPGKIFTDLLCYLLGVVQHLKR